MRKLACSLFALVLSLATLAQPKADYNVVPLPQHIGQLDTTLHFTLRPHFTIAYTAGNAELERNAGFLQQYVRELTQMNSTTVPSGKGVKADSTLQLRPAKQRTTQPEAYTLNIDKKGILISANSGEGIFRAIQTLRKSLPIEDCQEVLFPYAVIDDEARFAYRGQHLDVARHFFDAEYIKTFIDILALHGINQFHWHITDDQGWRFEVKSMPELAPKASIRKKTVIGRNCYSKHSYLYDNTEYGRGCYYTQQQMRDIVQYAAERYINIIPEIDLPGHMVAALSVYPELGCTGGPYEVWPVWGVADDVLCAGNPRTMEFLKKVLTEVCDIFPSRYIHIGGD